MTIDADEAEELKRRLGTAAEGTPEGKDDEAVARRLLTRQADALIEEIRGSINFFMSQEESGDALDRLLVAGNAARLPHLANRLGKALDVPVQPAKVLDHVEVGRVQLSEAELLDAQPILPTAVGLALWGVEQ